MDLRDIGFDQWFEAQAVLHGEEGCRVARVCSVDRGAYLIRDAEGEFYAELAGKQAHAVERAADLPCVGDWVTVRPYNDHSAALIHGLLPRRTFLRRKAPGESVDFQMIAANVDIAFLVQSCHFDFNVNRLQRYLVMVADGGVEPVVLLTKTDLVSPDTLQEQCAALRSFTSARILALSAITGEGLAEVQEMLAPGRTYCFLGSSGVGKTTLINHLLGRDAFATRAVSGSGEGTHTTTRRQLIVLPQGAMLVDTPGMRELGLVGMGEGIDLGFSELNQLAARCRYADCSHECEPGCAVRAAIEQGTLDSGLYANYLKLRKESAYHEMTSLARRKKDKDFGRFLKTAKKRRKD